MTKETRENKQRQIYFGTECVTDNSAAVVVRRGRGLVRICPIQGEDGLERMSHESEVVSIDYVDVPAGKMWSPDEIRAALKRGNPDFDDGHIDWLYELLTSPICDDETSLF